MIIRSSRSPIQWIVGASFLKNVYSAYRYNPAAVGFAALASGASTITNGTSTGTTSGGTTGNGTASGSGSGSGTGSSSGASATVEAAWAGLALGAVGVLAAAML
jgi:hypothetical protein